MEQKTKTKLLIAFKTLSFLVFAVLLVSPIFQSKIKVNQIKWEQEKDDFEKRISQLDSIFQNTNTNLEIASAINLERKLLYSEIEHAQDFLNDVYEITKTIVDTSDLHFEKEEIAYDWNKKTRKLWNLGLKDSTNHKLRNEIVQLLEKRYNSIWNNRGMVLNSNSSIVEKLMDEKEKLQEANYELKKAELNAKIELTKAKPDCDNKDQENKIVNLEKDLAKEKFLYDTRIMLAQVNIQIIEIDKVQKLLVEQNEIPCVQCSKRKSGILKKIRDTENIKLQLETKKSQLQRELKQRELSVNLAQL